MVSNVIIGNAGIYLKIFALIKDDPQNVNPEILYFDHGLRTPREEIAFTARPKIQSQSQTFRYGLSIFCLPHRTNFSDNFDLCVHWVSVVRVFDQVDKLEYTHAHL